MRYLVRINDLKDKIAYFEKQLSIINDNVDYLENIKSTIVWNGDTADKFMSLYDKYILELRKIERDIIHCIEYLMSFSSKYGNEYEVLRNKYQNIFNKGVYNEKNSI